MIRIHKSRLYFVGRGSDLRPTQVRPKCIILTKLLNYGIRLNKDTIFCCRSDGKTKVGLFFDGFKQASLIMLCNRLKNNAFIFCSHRCDMCGGFEPNNDYQIALLNFNTVLFLLNLNIYFLAIASQMLA